MLIREGEIMPPQSDVSYLDFNKSSATEFSQLPVDKMMKLRQDECTLCQTENYLISEGSDE